VGLTVIQCENSVGKGVVVGEDGNVMDSRSTAGDIVVHQTQITRLGTRDPSWPVSGMKTIHYRRPSSKQVKRLRRDREGEIPLAQLADIEGRLFVFWVVGGENGAILSKQLQSVEYCPRSAMRWTRTSLISAWGYWYTNVKNGVIWMGVNHDALVNVRVL